MCNLYRTATAAEAAEHFDAEVPVNVNTSAEVYPGGSGLVVVEQDGGRKVRSMTWGFPLAMKSKKTGLPIKPKPVNNIADLSSWMWRHIAGKPEHRCLIPVTRFAEAEGEKGHKTRTWFSVSDQPVFAWAGMWRDSDEWGPVYSGLMTDANAAVAPVHDRMPVILWPDEHDAWLHCSLEDVQAFQARVFAPASIAIERTGDPWIRRASTT